MPRGPETAISGVLHVLRQACCPSWGLWLSTLQEGFTSHGLRGKQTGRRASRVAGQGGLVTAGQAHPPPAHLRSQATDGGDHRPKCTRPHQSPDWPHTLKGLGPNTAYLPERPRHCCLSPQINYRNKLHLHSPEDQLVWFTGSLKGLLPSGAVFGPRSILQ